jgi:uncharacterized membrane protein
MDCWEDSVIIAKQLCNTLLAVPDRLSLLTTFYNTKYDFQRGGPMGMLIGLFFFDPIMLPCVGVVQ